jgi:GNAT superfamily N-acetyltransferase
VGRRYQLDDDLVVTVGGEPWPETNVPERRIRAALGWCVRCENLIVDIADTGLAGQVAWFRFLAHSSAAHVWKEGTGLAVVTGLSSNSDNGIVLDRAALGNERLVRSLVHGVLDLGAPASLVLSQAVPESETGLLLELGLSPENSANEMGKSIGPRPTISPPAGVEITEVLDDEQLHVGLRALGTEWFDEVECLKYLDVYKQMGYGPGHRVRHWNAVAEGQVIAMATSFRFMDVVTLMHCGVVESERRRGVATALTAVRLNAALDDGAEHAVLSPSPDGYQLHRRLGFRLSPTPPNRWFYLPVPGG